MATKKATPKKQAETNLSLKVLSDKGLTKESVNLDPIIANIDINDHAFYQYEMMYQANQRLATAWTKDRGAVSGGGKKPWKQKGTGRARHGSTRSPIWRGGGTVFGPQMRTYSYSLPKNMKNRVLGALLKKKAMSESLYMIDQFKLNQPKTKEFMSRITGWKFKKPLIVTDQYDQNVYLASRNLKKAHVADGSSLSAHDVMAFNECIITKGAYQKLIDRIKQS